MAGRMFRVMTRLASPSGNRARLTTFIFHRVLNKEDDLLRGVPDRKRFDRLLGWITSQYRVLDPQLACEQLLDGNLPARAAIITFDDGYADNYLNALPVLKSHELSACFFIATGFINGGAMFNDRVCYAVRDSHQDHLELDWLDGGPLSLQTMEAKRASLQRLLLAVKSLPLAERHSRVDELVQLLQADAPNTLMMDESQLRAMIDAGMTIGGHTRNHPILTSLSPEQAKAEIVDGRADLTAITGQAPLLFAYPNGVPGKDFDATHLQMVEQVGFRFAFSTQKGAAIRSSHRYALPRFTPWDRSASKFQLRALLNTYEGDAGLPLS